MKETPDSDIDAIAKDYTDAVDRLARYADVLVVNVSSPNTPGLRNLQASEPLTKILSAVVDSAKAIQRKTKPAVMVKVSPDEDSEEQVDGICAAVWASGVDGVIVGNTTKKRPDPLSLGYQMSPDEQKIMLEMGGYSGPQMFERTLALVRKYRSALDQGPREAAAPKSEKPSPPERQASTSTPASEQTPNDSTSSDSTPSDSLSPSFAEKVSASVERDAERLKPLTSEADAESKQPLVRLPERHTTDDNDLQAAEPALSASNHEVQGSSPPASSKISSSSSSATLESSSSSSPASTSASAVPEPAQQQEKVIFATGGITNGKQALEVLNAGASVAFVYTAVVYGGAGTITRIKREMREEIGKGKTQ